MSKEGHLARIGNEFNEEIEKIKKTRIKLGKDKNKKSTRVLTNLILKHKHWESIKLDMVNLIFTKNGGKE